MIDVFEDFFYIIFYKSYNVFVIYKFNNIQVKDRVLFKNMKYIGDIVILYFSKQKVFSEYIVDDLK